VILTPKKPTKTKSMTVKEYLAGFANKCSDDYALLGDTAPLAIKASAKESMELSQDWAGVLAFSTVPITLNQVRTTPRGKEMVRLSGRARVGLRKG